VLLKILAAPDYNPPSSVGQDGKGKNYSLPIPSGLFLVNK
jgi:hypothetical protein